MLILTRRADEAIMIGDDIEVLVMAIHGSQVRIGVKAPREVVVDRKEVAERKAVEAAGEKQVRILRRGIDYDADAVCPGCGCFRDRCACDLREAGADPNNGLPEPSSFPPMPAMKGNMSGTGKINIRRALAKLAAAENPETPIEKN